MSDKILELVYSLLKADDMPSLPDSLRNEEIIRVYDYLISTRDLLTALSRGHTVGDIALDGFTGEALKELRNYIEENKDIEQALRKSEEMYRRLARIDPLTGIYNRRHFEELADVELERMHRSNYKSCIAMADIDHFKAFNDKYGHLAGDKCLQQVSALISKQIRKVDLCGRYGGEEFIIMLPNTPLHIGMIVCERVREAIESTPVKVDSQQTNVTITIGVTEILPAYMDNSGTENVLKTAIDEADKALYAAKNASRNYIQQFVRF